MKFSRCRFLCLVHATLLISFALRADDWPQWRGPNRDGVWNETGILQSFPDDGLKVQWRASVGAGLSTPVVAQGRVYLTDSKIEKPKAWERVHCFDEKTGSVLWTYSYEANYPDWAFDPKTPGTGPGATPIVESGKLFSIGAAGDLCCLDAEKGTVAWKKNLAKDCGLADLSGTTPSPLIEGDLLILVIGGKPDACVMAFDKHSGKEIWRALGDRWTYSSPIVISAGGKRQLIVWTPQAVTSLDPATGKTWWREPVNTTNDYGTATPVCVGDRLLVGGMMFRLDSDKPAASLLWPATKTPSRVILSQTSPPMLQGDLVFSHKTSGHLVCLDARTGERIWQNDTVTDLKTGACIHITPNGGSVLIYNDRGELIRARLDAKGYTETSRARLIAPTYSFGGRKLVWPPPAFANRHVFARSDEEIVCASLDANIAP